VLTPATSIRTGRVESNLDAVGGTFVTQVHYIACPNPACNRLSVNLVYGRGQPYANSDYVNWLGSPRSLRLPSVDTQIRPPVDT
jgi:hypothetical protein